MNVLQQRAESLRLLSRKFNHKEGVVKINTHNTFKHELAKFMRCWQLSKEGKVWVTEAIFENGKRADIFVLDDKEAIEILESETLKQFKKKLDTYPCAVFPIKADDVLLPLFTMDNVEAYLERAFGGLKRGSV